MIKHDREVVPKQFKARHCKEGSARRGNPFSNLFCFFTDLI